jgi:hypothetical protein
VRVYIERPDGQIVEHRPPVYRLIAPEDVVVLTPGERHVTAVQLSFPATGPEFVNPGQYRVRALVTPDASAMLPSNDVRVRVAHPATRLGEELTELVTRPEVAKFLYFGGSARRPELADDLTEIAERFEETSPATIAHLRAALGEHAARDAKFVAVRDGARKVTVRTGDPDAAARHLDAGIKLGREHQTLPTAELDRLSDKLNQARATSDKPARRRAPAKKRPTKR